MRLTATERETLCRATARTSGFCEDRVYPAVEAILTARLAAVEALADEFRDQKVRAAQWAASSDDFIEAMSRKVAWESAESRLRAALTPEATP